MADSIKCRQAEGLPYQSGVTPQLAGQIARASEFLFHSLLKAGEHSTDQREEEERRMLNDRSSLYNENLRLGIGRFITSLLPHFHAALTPSPSSHPHPRLVAFAGHDSTMIPALAALGFDAALEGHWPPFASYIVLELLREEGEERRGGGGGNGDRWVRVVYNGKEVEVMKWKEFERRAENVRVRDYEAECRPHGDKPVPPQVW